MHEIHGKIHSLANAPEPIAVKKADDQRADVQRAQVQEENFNDVQQDVRLADAQRANNSNSRGGMMAPPPPRQTKNMAKQKPSAAVLAGTPFAKIDKQKAKDKLSGTIADFAPDTSPMVPAIIVQCVKEVLVKDYVFINFFK